MRYDDREGGWYSADGSQRWTGQRWEPSAAGGRGRQVVPRLGRGRRWPAIALAVMLAVALLAGAVLLAVAYQSNAELSRHLAASRSQAAALDSAGRDLKQRNSDLQQQVTALDTQVRQLQTQVGQLEQAGRQPTLGIWNVPQRLPGPDNYSAGGVPDTFTYHLKLTASGAMSVSILTFQQFAQASSCVRSGGGNSHYCMHHSGGQNWPDVTSLNYDFHDAEGCAGYLMVITAGQPVTVTPDVSVTYNPAPRATGVCA